MLELQQKGQPADFETVLADIRARDYRDSHRAVAPLRQAEDAVLLDTSMLDFEQSFAAMKDIISAHIGVKKGQRYVLYLASRRMARVASGLSHPRCRGGRISRAGGLCTCA